MESVRPAVASDAATLAEFLVALEDELAPMRGRLRVRAIDALTVAHKLTPRGEKHAQRMAQWVDQQLPEGVRILCSPAVRAEQTVQPLKRKYKVEYLNEGKKVMGSQKTASAP